MTPPTPSADPGDALARIARALDLPVPTFFETVAAASRPAQAAALLRAFEAIRDPAARARCLGFTIAEADRA